MLAPMILPLQITFVLYFVLVPVVLAKCEQKKIRIQAIISLFASFPVATIGIGRVVDCFRYGEFHVSHSSGIKDPYVRLPSEATQILLHKSASGHAVRFSSDREVFLEWLAKEYVRRNPHSRRSPYTPAATNLEERARRIRFSIDFKDYGWKMPMDIQLYEVPYANSKRSMEVWYSHSEGRGYNRTSYW